MIFCVVPPELEDELYEKLVEYYKANPNVKVIVDRRGTQSPAPDTEKGTNRRRQRISGTFPTIDAP